MIFSTGFNPLWGASELRTALLKVSNNPKVSIAIISFLNIYFLLKIRKQGIAGQNVKIDPAADVI